MIKKELVKYKSKITENSNNILKLFDQLVEAAGRKNVSKCQMLVESISALEASNRKLKLMIDELLKLGEEE